MKKRFLFGPIILAFLLFFTAILIPNAWLAKLVPKDRVETSATEINPMMFQGMYLQGKALEDPKYLPIYGSSELSRLDAFHPSNYFKVNNQGSRLTWSERRFTVLDSCNQLCGAVWSIKEQENRFHYFSAVVSKRRLGRIPLCAELLGFAGIRSCVQSKCRSRAEEKNDQTHA